MALKEGQRVKLAADIRLTDTVAMEEGSSAGASPAAGYPSLSLALAAGTEGIVEGVVEYRQPSHEVREYERLTSLRDSFGHEMPPESRRRLEEEIGSLEPDWVAYQEHGLRATVRVRLDNGFILDGAPEDAFTPA
ncbi:hypothetical protein ACFTWH_06185 [Streptomyces sp. NPDC057011]|uniref:hypothetical protein n=1 Tax=unclassified Streptomyces TaxID=2593676 RepID=UPI0036306907